MLRGVGRVARVVCVLATLGAVSGTLAACNAVKGIGRDIEAMGQGGQDMIDGKK